MFSPQPPAGDSAAAARRRTRPISRPNSRNTHRNERAGSSTPIARGGREGSIVSLRGASGLDKELRPTALAAARGDGGGKDMDGGVVDWTKNEKYRVAKLPALPAILKNCTVDGTPITAVTDSANGHALLLSHTSAYVWKYTSGHTIPHTLSFPLPGDEKSSTNNPFPLGALVSPSANSDEPGLVVVMPTSGRIAYWDSVGSAVAEGLFSKKRGVEGRVSLVSGESVTAICSAEPAGFLLSLSSGRLAHLALRDLAGRPGIAVTIMRGYGTGMMGGLLGALRAGSSRRDIVAVRAGKVLRMGEREIVVATARGNFSRWQVNRSGTHANIADVDLRENVLAAIERTALDEVGTRSRDQFVIVDAAVASSGESTNDGVDVLVLASFMPSVTTPGALYILVSITFLAGGKAEVGDVHVVKNYTNPLEEGKARPRLYLPKPGKTAFLVFARAVVIVSTVKQELGEDEMDEGRKAPGVFEDVVDFRGDLKVETVGSGVEDVVFDSIPRMEGSFMTSSFVSDAGMGVVGKKMRNPGVILIAKGAGVVRIETFDLEPVKAKALREPVKVKSKIEQAVFYGVKEDNPLNFQGRKEVNYPLEEIETAALEISTEILSSSSEYLPALLPSLEGHLSLRATHLRALAEHLQSTFPPLSRETMWRLLTDAEKCEAARAVWAARDARLRLDPDAGEGVLENVVAELLSSEDGDIGGHDPTRTWFQQFAGTIEELLPLAKRELVIQSKRGRYYELIFVKMDAEANDIVLGSLMAAWRFRVHAARLYGMGDGVDANGIVLRASGLAPPWTSGTEILQALDVQYDLSRSLLKSLWGPGLTADEERREAAERLAGQLVGLAEVCCRGFEERASWCEQQTAAGGEGILQEGITVKERYIASRSGWIKPLVEIGRADKAYSIAEKWQDYRTLVELCSEELVRADLAAEERSSDPGATDMEEKMAEIQKSKKQTYQRVEHYFETFGVSFATEMYEYLVEKGQLHTLMNGFENWREKYLTDFLRSSKKYAKLEWIHDVGLGELALAANTLNAIAIDQEDSLWSKKVELSIGKLAKLAATMNGLQGSVGGLLMQEDIRLVDADLELVTIQEQIYGAVRHLKGQTIDTEAAIQVGLDTFARTLVGRKRVGCRDIWKRAFGRTVEGKVIGVEEIADLLTLADEGGELVGRNARGEEFYWALKVLSLGGLRKDRREFMEKAVWRRCYLKDDWLKIVDTKGRSDKQVEDATHDTALWTTIRLGYEKGLFTDISPFRPLSPEETLFSEQLDELKGRFSRADESELTLIAHDLMTENRQLERFIMKASLDRWFKGVLEGARNAAMHMADETMEEDIFEEGDTIMDE